MKCNLNTKDTKDAKEKYLTLAYFVSFVFNLPPCRNTTRGLKADR